MSPYITFPQLNFIIKKNQLFPNWGSFNQVTSLTTFHNANNPDANGNNRGNICQAVDYDVANNILLVGVSQTGGQFATNNRGTIYRSNDRGSTWIRTPILNNQAVNNIQSIRFLGGTGGTSSFFACTGGHTGDGDLYITNNGGTTWTRIADFGNHDAIYQARDLGGGVYIFGAGYNPGDGDIFRSTNSGTSWTTVMNSGAAGSISLFHDWTNATTGVRTILAQQNNPNNLIASTNLGQNWAYQVPTGSPYLTLSGPFTEHVGNGRLLAVSRLGNPTTGIVISESNDFGVTWSNVTNINTGNNTFASFIKYLGNGVVVIAVYTQANGFTTTGASIYQSNDFGATWNTTPVYSPGIYSFSDIDVADDGTIWLTGTNNLAGGQPVLFEGR